MSDFHFLRPEWFIAFIPFVIVFFMQQRKLKLKGQWKNIVSPALQPYMLKHQTENKSSSVIKYALLAAVLLSIFALAGPSWKKQPSQVFNSQAGLIIALDLSLSMTAQDVSPSRLQRAKYKIRDVLNQNIGSNIALIAYAGDSHVASPLTRDVKTIKSMLPALDPYIMPAQGSNVRRLVDESIKLFEQGKSSPKTLLLVSDGVEESDIEYASNALKSENIHLSILAIGTEQGAPLVQPDGRFFKDSKGQVIMPELEWDNLKALADQSNGRIRALTGSDSDIQYLTNIKNLSQEYQETEESVEFDQWFDSGYWLIFPALLLALISFRKGVLLSLCIVLLLPDTSWADQTDIKTSSMPDLLLNSDQAAMKQFESNPAEAAEMFSNKQWKASSLYKAGDYESALPHWDNLKDTESLYNKANTLAHLNKLDEALAAYEKVLEQKPDHEDAKFNKKLIEKMIQQQDSQQSKQDSDKNSDQDSDNKDSDQSESSDGEKSDDNSQKSDQESSKDDESQDSQPSEADQDQSSENPANQTPEEQSQKDSEEQSAEQQSSENPDQENEKSVQSQQDSDEQSEELSEQSMPQAGQQDTEQEQAMKQWMKRIPDDPGGLLRNKFLYQYKNRNRTEQDGERKPW